MKHKRKMRSGLATATLAGTGLMLLAAETFAGQGPQPSICVRSCWGARAARSTHTQMAALSRAIVHHTAGSSDWTTNYETGKAKVRGVQNLHMDANGWADIGYHFLVNAGGHIYEGRAGSMSSLPRGAHDSVNANSFGFTALGYFHTPYNHSFTTAAQNSIMDVIAWRMPSAWSPYGSGSYGGQSVGYLDGHNRVTSTACPGSIIYNNYITDNRSGGALRDGVNARKNGNPPPPPPGPNTSGRWYFDTGGDGWSAMNGTTPLVWHNDSTWPGVVYADQNANDAYWWSPGCAIPGGADASINVDVYPQSGSSASHDMKVYWATTAESFTDEAKSSPLVTFNAQNAWRRINLNVSSAKWNAQTVNLLRLDFDNNNVGTRWIVNHVYTQTTPKYWFGSGTSGWTLGNNLTALGWNNSGWPGVIYADQVGNDAWFYSPTINYLGGANDQVVVRLYIQSSSTINHDMQLFWKTHTEDYYDASKSCAIVNYTLANDNWAIITLDVGANPKWSNAFVTQLRLDVDNNKGANNPRWIIDYVAISHSTAAKY